MKKKKKLVRKISKLKKNKKVAKKPKKILGLKKKKVIKKRKIKLKKPKKIIARVKKNKKAKVIKVKKATKVTRVLKATRAPAIKKPEIIQNQITPVNGLFKAKIKVIGIGGGGSSIVSEIGKSLNKATFLTCDTDMRAFKKKSGIKRFLFGQNITFGLGTGVNPELGKKVAEQEKEKIKTFFQDQDIVILIASLGGGFGSGAAQVFADVAQEFNGITFGIFTLPFTFEGKNKHAIALKALKELRQSLNVSLTLSNERIFKIIDTNVAITDAFSMVNKNLINLLESLIDLIYTPGIINIDFADLRAILKNKGSLAFLNTAEASGKHRADQVIDKILHNPLYQHNNFTTEKILFNIAGGENVSLVEVDKISRSISHLHSDAKIIFGISKNPKLKNKIKTTLLMTGPGTGASAPRFVVEKKSPAEEVIAKKQNKKQKASKKKKDTAGDFDKKDPENLPASSYSPGLAFDLKSRESEFSESGIKKLSVTESSNNKKAIRRSALQIQEAQKLEDDKQSLQEEEWEIPAFLRNKVKSK